MYRRAVAQVAIVALCMLAPTCVLAETSTQMGPRMMDEMMDGRGDPEPRRAPASLPEPQGSDRSPQKSVSEKGVSAQMNGPMGHQGGGQPFYRESTFLVLVSLVLGAGAVAGYRLTRTRWRRPRGGAAFVTEAVLVVDLIQSTHLATHYGDGLAMKARTALKDRTLAIARRQGLVFAENTGDGYFMTFRDVAGAMRTAFALLADLRERPPDLGPAPPLEVRIGIAYGEILLDARGVRHGAVINKAFRLEGLSRDAFELVEGDGDAAASPERDRIFLGEDAAEEARARGFSLALVGICALKGFPGLHRVYRAVTRGEERG